ncbi:hypothetical protein AXE80_10325 [Wenyingzhuangia fucanilytica]|uniref:Sulfatase N-terminal domain-containing protein n=1 Tax=Wenyingzhuangia fucanilytica TaxID=1790137 RepID=A0A1B1Y7A0_9FLAO|nr:sulfatase [Wenyingzhuangia fucanilytica]ANW96646.1 hypothetical protein AXE80_10325 [Wenyingzhuangia fucanilytica]
MKTSMFFKMFWVLSIQLVLAQNSKPNIIILHVDDLGYHDLSCNGSKIYQTPNIDQLAKESVVFKNAYANYPRCVPSRYAMMTGDYPVKDGDVPDDGFEMSDVKDSKNFVHKLNKAGYQTAYFGKWHLGDEESSPKGFGYDVSVAAGHAGSPISYIYPFNTPKGHNKNVKKAPIKDLEEISKKGDYLTDVLTTQVLQHIDSVDKSKPFMAMLAFYAVHQPIEAKKEDVDRNKKQIKSFDYGNQPEYILEGTGRTKMRQDNAEYAAMVENMDVNVGRVLNELKKLGIADNTIIILSSDHGGLSNDGTHKRQLATSNFPLRAGKGWLYEGGIKIPFMVKWNNHFTPRVEENSLVMLMDVFPTLIDVAGEKKVCGVNGKSLLPVLKGKKDWSDREVYWHSSKARPVNTGDAKSSAVRKGDWKLIDFYEKGVVELYNLKQDPYEKNNVAKENPKITASLSKDLQKWKKSF